MITTIIITTMIMITIIITITILITINSNYYYYYYQELLPAVGAEATPSIHLSNTDFEIVLI